MATGDDFTFVESEGMQGSKPRKLFDDYQSFTSGKVTDLDTQIVTALRAKNPELTVTTVPGNNCNLLQFAAAGFAQAELDNDAEPIVRWRGFIGPAHRGGQGFLADSIFYARYNYTWNTENFVLYTVRVGYSSLQYILKETRGDETPLSNSSVVSSLLATIGAWLIQEEPAIYVYDRYWTRSTKLWEEVKKAKWDDVILDPKMKKALTEVAEKFFDSKDIYDEYGVPWKRGLIFYGPVGNGKTISLKALMHTLYDRKSPVVTLYVKHAPDTYDLKNVFAMARSMSPCMLVLEDVETIVTNTTRSYFFNEVDGIENNDGILMVATTNYLDRLDPGLSKRPSRFDRKYLFPRPNKEERSLYAQYWRNKLKNKKELEFPSKLCDAIANITDDFSFAYMKEDFVATLLELARNHGNESDNEEGSDSEDDDPLDKYEFWRAFKAQTKVLRKEMGDGEESAPAANEGFSSTAMAAMFDGMRLQDGSQPGGKAASPLADDARIAHRVPGKAPLLNQSANNGPSIASPMYSFEPLARTKVSKFNNSVWEWGTG